MSDQRETDVLKGFLSGDTEIIGDIYREHYPEVKSYILKNSGTVFDAQDIFQDAIVLTYQKLKSGSLHLQCSLATYIFAVSRNMWMNALRKRKKVLTWDVPLEISDDLQQDILDELQRKQQQRVYQKYFLTLGKDCQELLRHFFGGKSMRDIADLMNYSSGYARKKKFECKKRLIEMLESDPLFKELSAEGHKEKSS